MMLKESERIRRLENRLMEKLFDNKIMNSIIDTNHIRIMHEKSNNTDTALLDRTINPYEKTKSASTFNCNMRDTIENALMNSVPDIIQWLISSNRKTITITPKDDEYIGHGIENKTNTIKEYNTKEITLVLTKDDNNDVGFRCQTAYPNVTHIATTRTATERNLIPDLIQTRTFKRSTPEERAAFVNAVIKGLNRPLSFMESIHADIVANPAFTNNMIISFSDDEIIIYHPHKTGCSVLQITPDNAEMKDGYTPEISTLKNLAQDKINKRLGKAPDTTKPLTHEQRLTRIGIESNYVSTDISLSKKNNDDPTFK